MGARFPEDVNRPAATLSRTCGRAASAAWMTFGMSVCGSLWVGLVPVLPGSRCPYTVVRGSRGAALTARSGLTSELGPEPGGEPHGGLDLDFANGDAFDIEPKRDTNAPAESDQLDGRVDCLVVGRVEGVIGMA